MKLASPGRHSRHGLIMAELLLSVALTALLLTAAGTALFGMLRSYEDTSNSASVQQAARAVLGRMTRDIRCADGVDANASRITLIPPADGSGLQQIQYDYTGGLLYYRRTVGGVTTSYVLLGSDVPLTGFSASSLSGKDWQGLTCLTDVTVSIGLKLGNQSLSLTASASPRRNQLY